MESIITSKKELTYPCLKKFGDTLILFTRPNCGIALNNAQLGEYSENWAEKSFIPFTGEITLKN